MKYRSRGLRSTLLVLFMLATACQPIRPEAAQLAAQTTDTQIQNALSAAPLAIAEAATILDYPTVEGGDMVVLREGTNGWTCFTDWPVTPENDPACYDSVWMTLNDALAAGLEPEITSPGLGYMLAGGNDPSNTDPFAFAPAPGEDWITTPAHLMLLVPGGFDASQFTTDHTAGYPFIMWDGTPYEHLMIPVNSNAMAMAHGAMPPQTVSSPNQQTAADQELASQIDELMNKLNAEGTFNGSVLIARNGQVVLRKGYGLADRAQNLPNTPTTRFRLASITKQFTAMAILMLQEQGKLNVEDQVCQYIADCPTAWQGMTIHHLLTHTAGVYDFRDFIYTGQTSPTPSTAAQVIERIKEKPLAFAPGEGWSYTNGGFMVAGYIVEQVSGQGYAQFLQEQIFDPLGMKNTGYADNATALAVGYRNATTQENPLDSSLLLGAAGLYSTVEDLYLYAQALDSGKLLPPQSLAQFFKEHVRLGEGNGGFSPGYEAPVFYAYGWGVATFHGHRVIGHDGWIEGYGGDLRRYPDDTITTILLMNQSEPYAALLGDQIAEVIFATE